MQQQLSAHQRAFRPAAASSCRVARPARLCVACVARPRGAAAATSTSTSADAPRADVGLLYTAGAALAPLLLHADAAFAKDGEFGILEGRTAALLHPAIMLTLFGATLYAGYLGYQWKRTREIGDEIKDLKKQLPALAADGVRPPSPLDAAVEQKEKERKDLLAGNYRDKHWQWGSVLLASGVGIAIEGCANTYMRTGRLFPGPHLYAGATIVALWAAAAALVPAMQKGNNTARQAHIALNVANVALFLWQVPTGFEIVDKVFQFTVWP